MLNNPYLKQRLESLKAGLCCCITASLIYLPLIFLGKHLIGLDLAIALFGMGLSGFLMGVTYRYLLIYDLENFHLKSGAVFAFSLIRSSSFLELDWQQWKTLLQILLDSFLPFAIAAIVLEIMIRKSWINLEDEQP